MIQENSHSIVQPYLKNTDRLKKKFIFPLKEEIKLKDYQQKFKVESRRVKRTNMTCADLRVIKQAADIKKIHSRGVRARIDVLLYYPIRSTSMKYLP